jgi:CPA2 family monovalent cation:H+ antiporter-2
MTVYEADVPGVGKRFELDVESGARAVVLLHHDGRVERDLYAAVFFSVGLATDLSTLVPVLALAVLSVFGKLVTGYLGGRAYGLTQKRSVRAAVTMVARGEFSLVIAALAVQTGLDPRLSALVVGSVLVMSVLGTGLMSQSTRVEALAERSLGPGTPGGGAEPEVS